LTGLGNLARVMWRDRRDNRRELEVTHGWQFAFNPDNSLRDVWVCVTLFNKGRKPFHVQYVGFEAAVVGDPTLAEQAGIDLPAENVVWTTSDSRLHLVARAWKLLRMVRAFGFGPDSSQSVRHSIDPTESPVRAYAVTYPETHWWESTPAPLLPEPTQIHRTREAVGEAVALLLLSEMGNDDMEPAPDLPGTVVGLQRLVMDGEVYHVRASDLLSSAGRTTGSKGGADGDEPGPVVG
jgi:hypothetical protein